MRRVLRQVGLEVLVLAGFFGLASAVTWPLLRHLDSLVAYPEDPFLTTWILDWNWHALVTPARLFDANMFHPHRYSLALSEHLAGIAIVLVPVRMLGVPPLAAHSIALLLGFAFSGYGAYVLGRVLTGSRLAGTVGGIFFLLLPYRFGHLTHVQHVWSGWLPILLAAAIVYARQPSWRRAAMFGAAFLMNGLTNVHWLLMGSVAVAVASVFLASVRGLRARESWPRLIVALGIAGLLQLPFLLPYRWVSDLYGLQRGAAETSAYSAEWSDWLRPNPANKLYADFTFDPSVNPERWLFPGLGVLALALAAVLLGRRENFAEFPVAAAGRPPSRWLLRALDLSIVLSAVFAYYGAGTLRTLEARVGGVRLWRFEDGSTAAAIALVLLLVRWWLALPTAVGGSLRECIRDSRFPAPVWVAFLWIAIGVVGSLGLNAFLHEALFDNVSAFRSMRVPARWAMIAYTGLAGLAACGAHALSALLRGRTVVAALLAAGLIFELETYPIPWYRTPAPSPSVYGWLAKADVRAGVVELPLRQELSEYRYVLHATEHHRPILNGTSGFNPPRYESLVAAYRASPIPGDFLGRLEEMDCGIVVVHREHLADRTADVRRWLAESLGGGRLQFIGVFDGEDFVFALPKNLPKWRALRQSEVADRSGRTPSENATTFLASDAPVYHPAAFGFLESPQSGAQRRGALRVAGWALAPEGVKNVVLDFGTGRLRLAAKRYERSDVQAVFPWYGSSPLAGFYLDFAERPPQLGIETTLQVEIEDGSGAITRLPQTTFLWTD